MNSRPAGRRKKGATSFTPAALSLALCAFASYCYAVRPDPLAAFTVWPTWLWTSAGLLLAAMGGRRTPRRAALWLLAAWIGYTAAFTEEARSLLREPAGPKPPGAIRVVSVNCAGGNAAVAAEAMALSPDIVLLQESPSLAQLRRVAAAAGPGWSVAAGPEGSILAHGTMKRVGPPSGAFTHARVNLSGGVWLDVISLRLSTPAFRADLWSPDCWRSYAANRARQREELREAAGHLARYGAGGPAIVGGDFNAPQGDGAFTAMPTGFRDAFRESGRGWGDTILNDCPVLRIDQAWVSQGLSVHAVWARRTANSDHRMVVCDLTEAVTTRR
ncbi:MAG TPA: endonuclease/exonuclease/phosphatase family protein [Armatimonadota bacterium]|jgi:endonuclease/exonuclease/phosphatase (EEP) superfamily protein YafD